MSTLLRSIVDMRRRMCASAVDRVTLGTLESANSFPLAPSCYSPSNLFACWFVGSCICIETGNPKWLSFEIVARAERLWRDVYATNTTFFSAMVLATTLTLYRPMTPYGVMRLMFPFDQWRRRRHEYLPAFAGFPRKIAVYYASYTRVTVFNTSTGSWLCTF